jgi:hypothetical protein
MDPEALPQADARRVTTWTSLQRRGISRARIQAQLDARRWQRLGFAIVLHNGPLSERQRWTVARTHAGPLAILTAFTAAQAFGLRGWERETVHVLAPGGTRLRRGCPVKVRLHLSSQWAEVRTRPGSIVHALPEALVRAAATFASARPACGILPRPSSSA